MSFLGRKGLTLLPSPYAISPSGSIHEKLELELSDCLGCFLEQKYTGTTDKINKWMKL
jgi:hypothetical protein